MFNLADYEPVEVRLEKFIKDYPDFRISTELEVIETNRYVVKAYLYKNSTDTIAWATGLAEETVTSRGVNQTSALENCETSAIGRALANAGYAPKGKRPSREEMTKVVKAPAPTVEKDYWTTPFGDQDESLKKVDAPATIEAALNTVSEILGTAKVVPNCKHGDMEFKDGNKNGRAWGGYFCRHIGVQGSEPKCPTLWYQLSSQGTWEPQKARA
jgi:ssDNA-binding Zn-finger/Zn-ribbon topoisomerase 1